MAIIRAVLVSVMFCAGVLSFKGAEAALVASEEARARLQKSKADISAGNDGVSHD